MSEKPPPLFENTPTLPVNEYELPIRVKRAPSGRLQEIWNYEHLATQHASFNGKSIVTGGHNRPLILENKGGVVEPHLMGIKPPSVAPDVTVVTPGAFTGAIQVAVQRVDEDSGVRSGISPIWPSQDDADEFVTPAIPGDNGLDYAPNGTISLGPSREPFANRVIAQYFSLNTNSPNATFVAAQGSQVTGDFVFIERVTFYGFIPTQEQFKDEGQSLVVQCYKGAPSSLSKVGAEARVRLSDIASEQNPNTGVDIIAVFEKPLAIPKSEISQHALYLSIDENGASSFPRIVFFYDADANGLTQVSADVNWPTGAGFNDFSTNSVVSGREGTLDVPVGTRVRLGGEKATSVLTTFFIPAGEPTQIISATSIERTVNDTATPGVEDDVGVFKINASTFVSEHAGVRVQSLSRAYIAENTAISGQYFLLAKETDGVGFDGYKVVRYTGVNVTGLERFNGVKGRPLAFAQIGRYAVTGTTGTNYRVYSCDSNFQNWAATAFIPGPNSPADVFYIGTLPGSPAVVLLAGRNAVFRSTDGGVTFTSSFSASGITVLAIQAFDATSVLLVTRNTSDDVQFRFSSNGGASFGSPVTVGAGLGLSPNNAADVVRSVSSPATIYLAYQNRVYRSTDTGATWSLFATTGFTIEKLALSLTVSTQLIAAGSGYEPSAKANRKTIRVATFSVAAEQKRNLFYRIGRPSSKDAPSITYAELTASKVVISTSAMDAAEIEDLGRGGRERYNAYDILIRERLLGAEWRVVARVPLGSPFTFDIEREALAGYPTMLPEFYEVPGGFQDVENFKTTDAQRLCFAGQPGYDFFEGNPKSKDYAYRYEQMSLYNFNGLTMVVGPKLGNVELSPQQNGQLTIFGFPDKWLPFIQSARPSENILFPGNNLLFIAANSSVVGRASVVSVDSINGNDVTINYYTEDENAIEPAANVFFMPSRNYFFRGIDYASIGSIDFPIGTSSLTQDAIGAVTTSLIIQSPPETDPNLFDRVDGNEVVIAAFPNGEFIITRVRREPALGSTQLVLLDITDVSRLSFLDNVAFGIYPHESLVDGAALAFVDEQDNIIARGYAYSDPRQPGAIFVSSTVPDALPDGTMDVTPGVIGANPQSAECALEVRPVLRGTVKSGGRRVVINRSIADDYWHQRDIAFEGTDLRASIRKVLETSKPNGPVQSDRFELAEPWSGRSKIGAPIQIVSDYSSVWFAGGDPKSDEAISGLTKLDLNPDTGIVLITSAQGRLFAVTRQNEVFLMSPSNFQIPTLAEEFLNVFIDISAQVPAERQVSSFTCSSVNTARDDSGRFFFAGPQGVYYCVYPNVVLLDGQRDRFGKFLQTGHDRAALAMDSGIAPNAMLRVAGVQYGVNDTSNQMGFIPDLSSWTKFEKSAVVDSMASALLRDGSHSVLFGGKGKIGVYGSLIRGLDYTPFPGEKKNRNYFVNGQYSPGTYTFFVPKTAVTLEYNYVPPFNDPPGSQEYFIYKIDVTSVFPVTGNASSPTAAFDVSHFSTVYNVPKTFPLLGNLSVLSGGSGVKIVKWEYIARDQGNPYVDHGEEAEIIGVYADPTGSGREQFIYVRSDKAWGKGFGDDSDRFFFSIGARYFRVTTKEEKPSQGYTGLMLNSVELMIEPDGGVFEPYWISLKAFGAVRGASLDSKVPIFSRVIPWTRLATGQRAKFHMNTRVCRKIELQIEGFASGNGCATINDLRATYDDVMI